MRFEKEINIYSDEAIIKRFKANETSVSVVQGKISALISESELVELQNSQGTMYSKLAAATLGIEGLDLKFSDLTTKYNTVSNKYTALDSKVAQYKAGVEGLSANVSSVQTDVTNLKTWQKSTDLKITDSAIVATVTSSSSYKDSVSSLIEQKANSIRLKADRISWESTYSSMNEWGELTCRNAKIQGTFTNANGDNEVYMRNATMGFTRAGQKIGFIGTNNFESQTDFQGLVFDLENDAGYMCWAAEDSESSSTYTTKLIYYNKQKGLNKKGLHFHCNTYPNGNLWLADDVQLIEWNDGGCGIRGGKMTWCNVSNSNAVTIDGQRKSFTIWNNVNVGIYSNIDMHNWDIINQSDVRMKKNIQNCSINALELLNSIELKEFDWIETGQHEEIGVIAQQLEEVIPELTVIDEKTGKFSIKTTKFIMYILKAIQELSANSAVPFRNARSTWRDPYTLEEKMAFCERLYQSEEENIEKEHMPVKIKQM